METREISYSLRWPDEQETSITIVVDEKTHEIVRKRSKPPEWTKLDNAKCSNCTLDSLKHNHCPLAVALAAPIAQIPDVDATTPVDVTVDMEERQVLMKTSAQKAMSSLLGLIMPSSGCPHTRFLRPMGRFHLPFATHTETLYRTTSTYLLGQYLRDRSGKVPDYELAGLQRQYKELHTLNRDFSKRLRTMAERNAAFKAMFILDLFTITLPRGLDEMLEPIAALFSVYLDDD